MIRRFLLQAFVFAGLASAQLTLYGVSGVQGGTSSLYRIDPTTGAATLIGPTGFSGISSLDAVPGGGALYGIANSSGHVLIRINLATGAGTLIGPTGISVNVPDIAVRSDGAIFGADGNGLIYRFNPSTGAATLVGDSLLGFIGGGGIAFNSLGTLYLAAALSGGISARLYTINQTTGAATQSGTFNFSALPAMSDRLPGMKFHPTSGVLYGLVFVGLDPPTSERLVTAAATTGSIPLKSIGTPGVILEALAFATPGSSPPPPTVPIPSSLVLLGTGLIITSLFVYWQRGSRAIRG